MGGCNLKVGVVPGGHVVVVVRGLGEGQVGGRGARALALPDVHVHAEAATDL